MRPLHKESNPVAIERCTGEFIFFERNEIFNPLLQLLSFNQWFVQVFVKTMDITVACMQTVLHGLYGVADDLIV